MSSPLGGADIELLRSMVEIPSESGQERALATFLVMRMRAAGLDARLDEVGNVVGCTPPVDGPVILLLGHLDTVPGAILPVLDGQVLHGRGAVDAKGPLAAMVRAAVRLSGRIGAQLVVVGAVDEERTSVGARHLLDRHAPDAVVIGEPSGSTSVGLGYKGVLRVRLELRRPQAHTSSPDATAAEAAVALWTQLHERLAARYPETSTVFDRAMPSLLTVTGNLEVARLEVSCRTPIGFDSQAFVAELGELDSAAHITIVEDVPAVRVSRGDPVVRSIAGAIRRRGGKPVHKLKLGTSDMNLVVPRWGVPAAAYGPGDSRLCHTANERIDLAEYLESIAVLTDALPALAETLVARRARVAVSG